MAQNNTLSNDSMHNRNCYAYFLQLKPQINDAIIAVIPQFSEVDKLVNKEYSEHIPYGDLYSSCIAALEKVVTSTPSQIEVLDNLIHAVYHNNNRILEQAEWLNDIAAQTRPRQVNTSKHIEKKIKNFLPRVNSLSPEDTDRIITRMYSMLSKNFKPQLGTNTPTIKNYLYKEHSAPIEYRFSTQAQRHQGAVRTSPLFKRWLQIKAKLCPDEQTISHIYFNNLGFDRTNFDIPGFKERQLTLALHELESDPTLKVIVITLPAHKGLIRSSHVHVVDTPLPYPLIFTELLSVAKGDKHKSGVSDLIISKETKKALFQTKSNEELVLKELLDKSFQAHGIYPENCLSEQQKQAVWIHFIKYELTNYIIDTLKPNSFNFSCKDAIDRGALSSLYFNLMKSFESNHPMQQAEFERSLDAAAAMVKARGMNFHRTILWCTLDSYINAHYEKLITNKDKSWLIFWRDMNCPPQRVEQLLKLRVKQSLHQFDSQEDTQVIGSKLLSLIEKHSTEQDEGNRLLLEAVALTSRLITVPSPELIQNYKNLAVELRIKHPVLMAIYGAMQMLLGIVLLLPTFGYSKNLVTQGLATSKASFFTYQRAALSHEMLDFAVTRQADIPAQAI